ncbi:MAG: ribonuclease HII [Bdellovibrionales bacterium]|nr:ribonuclease HII [Bdellovibrionales bacterium]
MKQRPKKPNLKIKNNSLPIVDWQSFLPAPIIGVDEVGRGCLAGSVYAAAVILNPAYSVDHYTDSKLLSEPRREELFEEILLRHQIGIGFASVDEIFEMNIFRASLLAMRRAVEKLKQRTGHILVDGKFPIPDMKAFRQTPLIKGDLRAKPIAAASIVAKVSRDREMKKWAEKYPHYGFERHKGYATVDHKEAIQSFGVLHIHRKAFAGVREFVERSAEVDVISTVPRTVGRSPSS